MTNWAWSPRIHNMIGFGPVHTSEKPGDKIEMLRAGVRDAAALCELPFCRVAKYPYK